VNQYSIHFTVPASTYLEAVTNAVAMLRTGVKLRGVLSAHPTAGVYWDVTLSVSEDA
jgi:hypothetical protein